MPTWQTSAMRRFTDAGIDCSYRQLDYWCTHGLFGPANCRVGPGARRVFTDADLEVAHALTAVRKISGTVPLDLVAAAVRRRPVDPQGEWLVVTASGISHRARVVADLPVWAESAVIVVPLRSLSAVKVA